MSTTVIQHPDEPASDLSDKSRWSVGSLTYTSAGLVILFLLLLLGDFGWMMRERSVVPMSQLLLNKFQPSSLITSLLFGSIPAALTIVIWPVVSVWSDRTRSRWGRRVPFLFWPTPVVTGAMVGLAFSPQIGAWLQKLFHGTGPVNLWVIGVFAFFWILFEVFALVTNNIFIALVNDTVPRRIINRFFAMFRMVSLGAGVYFNYSLISKADTHFTVLFLSIAAVYLVSFLVMCWFVKEGTYPPPPPIEHSSGIFSKIKMYICECCHQPFYRTVFVTMALAGLTFMPVNIFSLFAAKSYGIDTGAYGNSLALTYIIGFVIAFPIGWFTDRFHPMRTGLVSLALYGTCMVAAYWIVCGPETFLAMFVVHGVAAGVYNTAVSGLLPMLFPREQFSQIFSATNILVNILNMIVSPLLGQVMDLTGNNYRLTFLLAGLIAFSGCACWLLLNRGFARNGGVKSYQPPVVEGF
jgi:MFS family permease